MVSPRCCASAGADPRGAPPAACCAPHDFFGHPGLSNAGLRGEEQHHGAPVRDLAERRFDRGRLRVAPDEGVGHERRVGLCHRLTIRLEHMSEKGSVVERAFPLTPDGAQYSFTSSQERSVPKDASVSSIHGM